MEFGLSPVSGSGYGCGIFSIAAITKAILPSNGGGVGGVVPGGDP